MLIRNWISSTKKKRIYKFLILSIILGAMEVITLISINPIINLFASKNQLDQSLILGLKYNNFLFLIIIIFALYAIFVSFCKN